ncbi:hypothetical protein ATOBIA_N03080 [Atopobiaceae bacterium P1]|nr:hypothetical protein ATOBIA_N03080 [Atopobiaceae bacterium P1]
MGAQEQPLGDNSWACTQKSYSHKGSDVLLTFDIRCLQRLYEIFIDIKGVSRWALGRVRGRTGSLCPGVQMLTRPQLFK